MGSSYQFFYRGGNTPVQEDHEEVPKITPIEALEAYSAEHSETIEELQNWYWKKFEKLYEAHLKRKAVESAEATKNAMVSGLWGNSNFDDDKNTRKKALIEIENSYNEAVLNVYNKKKQVEIDFKEDPFFAAMKIPDVPDRTTTIE